MRPLEKTGVHDPEEILEAEWVSMEDAQKRAKYKSDKTLLVKLTKELQGQGPAPAT
jgi:NADH pyrophosphatase NudC (nudix superfamily)